MKKILILLIYIFSFNSLFSQTTSDNLASDDAYIKQISFDNDQFYSNALIYQYGDHNNASINQTFAGTNVLGNIAELIQNGDFNDALLIQTGNGNTHLIIQTGNENIFEASVIGDNNYSRVDQFGNNNMINQNLVGNDMALTLSQIGNNNEISQTETAQQSRHLEITQTGNAMRLIIINGGVLP